ncbi:MAG: dehydrogenase [Naasia sp.]|nr:dehydrogenase [Naasia sp.]
MGPAALGEYRRSARAGLPAAGRRLPAPAHEFSGGQRQRIAIAIALVTKPELVIADGITSGLDPSTQAEILRLFDRLRHELRLTVLFISHDLAVVSRISDTVGVLFHGDLVECGPVSTVFQRPAAPYTAQLFASVPGAPGSSIDWRVREQCARRRRRGEPMKATVFRTSDETVEFADVDLAPPKAGEVRVRIAAAGVCHSDLHVRRGEWAAPVPMVMGHEGSGTVIELGEGVDTLAVGDSVVLSWVPPCGTCRNCRLGHEARCATVANLVAPKGVLFDGTSRLSMGGTPLHHYLGVSSYAEEAVVPASGAVKVRDDAPLDVLALVGCAVATGVGAVLNTAQVTAGSTVAVIGCGGVGLNIVQGARLAGAERIVAIDVLPAKTQLALEFGATDRIDATAGDAGEQLRAILPDGVDYAFDAIGRTTTTEQAIGMLGLGGAAVVVGLPPTGARASFEPLVLAEADQRILGSNYGGVRPSRDIPMLVDRYLNGELELDRLVSGRRPLAEAAAALDELESGVALRTLLIP